jgi:hypothetical protein
VSCKNPVVPDRRKKLKIFIKVDCFPRSGAPNRKPGSGLGRERA